MGLASSPPPQDAGAGRHARESATPAQASARFPRTCRADCVMPIRTNAEARLGAKGPASRGRRRGARLKRFLQSAARMLLPQFVQPDR
jgi:hypothetical protein